MPAWTPSAKRKKDQIHETWCHEIYFIDMADMRRVYIGGVAAAALCAAAGAFWYFGASGPVITNYPPREGPIVALGDSLIVGVGSTSGNDLVSLLSANIGRPIENSGVSGDTTTQGLARLEDVIEKDPSVVILLLGGNDYLQRRPREETFANMSEIIERLHAHGSVVVLLGVRGGVLRDSFAEGFEEIADRYHTAYVPDVLDGIIGDRALMSDQVHPNDAGYARIAERVYPVLSRILEVE